MDDLAKMFIAGARALRNDGEDLIKAHRANGLSAEVSLGVMAFLKEEEILRDDIAQAGVNAGEVPPLMEDLQRIADIRQQFEEVSQQADALLTKRFH